MAAAGTSGNTPRSAQRHRRNVTAESPSKPPKTRVKQHPLDMAARQRAVQAMQLRAEGMTYEEIAAIVGYANRSVAFNAIDRELGRMEQHSIEKLRRSEGLRLDRLDAVVLPKALKGDLWALDRVLNIQARRAKLWGIDVDAGEALAAMPYQKRIVLEDQPAIPAAGEIVE